MRPVRPSNPRSTPGIARGVSTSTILALVLTAALAGPVASQQLPFARYTAENGLAGSQIWDVREDRRGLLWIATTWGFSRFDGVSFRTFSVEEGLASPSARTLVEDLDGTIWFGNNSGVARYDGRQLVAFDADPQAPRSTVWSAAVDRAGRLWFGSEHGLFRYAAGRFRRFSSADGLLDDYVYSLLAASDGALWVGSRGRGLTRCELTANGDLGSCATFGREDGLPDLSVRALAEAPDGRVLVGTRGGGVALYDGGTLRPWRATGGPPSEDVYALLVRRGGEVVVGTAEEGLAICASIDRPSCRTVRKRHGLPANGIRALFEDRAGRLWIGSESGLAVLTREDIWNLGPEDALPDANVYAISVTPRGRVVLGTFDGVVEVDPDALVAGRSEGAERPAELRSHWIWALQHDRRGDLWAGTDRGLCRLRSGRCEWFRQEDGLPSTFVVAVGEDRDGDLWVSTSGGLARLRLDATGRRLGLDDYSDVAVLEGRRAYAILALADGEAWFATNDGLVRHDENGFELVDEIDDLAVRGLGSDREGRLLVGAYGGFARLEGREADGAFRFRRWRGLDELSGRMVLTLGESEGGTLWLGTSGGIVLVDPEAADGAGAVLDLIDSSSGVVASEVAHTAAFARDAAGRLWFGFKGGAAAIRPREPTPRDPPDVAFEQLESGQRRLFVAPFSSLARGPVGWLGDVAPVLPPGDESLWVEVRAVTLGPDRSRRFEFRLDPLESDWSEARARSSRDLTNLPPGRYRLHARAVGVGGLRGRPSTLEFEVQAPWWQSANLPLVALVLVGTALGAALWSWSRRSGRLRVELERRIAERTDDLARYSTALAEHLRSVDLEGDRARRVEEVRRDLFARASHELRTPLTAVLGFSELLERSLSGRLEEKEQRYLGNVRASGELLLRQVDDLLYQLQLEAGRAEVRLDDVAVGSLVESVVSLMDGFAQHRGVRLETRLDKGLPTALVDVAKLRQILTNLISNAIKVSPADGTVTVGARTIESDESPWARPAYEITVVDRGAGIDPAEQEAIFEPYRNGGATPPGGGLGLPIARQFAELLGGSIAVESERGVGSTFRVLLPVDPGPVSQHEDSIDSGSIEPVRAQVVVLEPDRGRFDRLTRGLGEELLALRAESVASLQRTLSVLRPQGVVLSLDPARRAGELDVVRGLLQLAEERQLAVIIVALVGERAVALPFCQVVSTESQESTMRRALRRADVQTRSFGRRPLALVAAKRSVGMRIGSALAAAGCDHFRVEGSVALREALGETDPEVVLVDLEHVPALALGKPQGASREDDRAGWILVADGVPGRSDLEALAEQVVAAGEEPALALAGAWRRLARPDERDARA